MDPCHLEDGGVIFGGEECAGAVVLHIDMEKIEDSPIQIGMLLVVGENHHIRVSALIDPVLILLHIIGGIRKLECLVPIKGPRHNLDMAAVIISEVII